MMPPPSPALENIGIGIRGRETNIFGIHPFIDGFNWGAATINIGV